MLPLKQARLILAQLAKLSLVETQEVPKSSAKLRISTASSEYHLWQIDLPRVYSILLAGLYKTLGNILQRRGAEMARRQAVLAREAASADAGGRARLQVKDQEDLLELDDVLRKFGVGEMRAEMVVFMLRDLPSSARTA